MGKLALKHELALRAKIKSDDSAEVTITDYTTKEVFVYDLNFREPKARASKSIKRLDDELSAAGEASQSSDEAMEE